MAGYRHVPPGVNGCPCKATRAPARLRVCLYRLLALRRALNAPVVKRARRAVGA